VAGAITTIGPVRIAVAADERTGVADAVVEALRRRGHEPIVHGALAEGERDDWAWASEAAARDVAEGRAVPGIRAALCADAATAEGARRWNDANVLALSLRTTSAAELEEILDGWFGGEASAEPDDRANVSHLSRIESERE
jgi:ribose 5-phosphate isomerase B